MLSGLLDEPVLEELSRRAVAQRGVVAPPVVEHGDVLEQVSLGLRSGLVSGAVHARVFQAVEEALRGRVVPTVALTAHTANRTVFGQQPLEIRACVLCDPRSE